MATELASAYVTLIPSLKGAEKTIQNALGGIDTTSAGKSMGAKLTKGIGGGLASVAKVGVGAIAAIGTAVGGLAIGGGISRAMKLDQAEYKFEAMGINVEKAMESCNEAVTGTAFGLDAAATVAAQLGTSGVKAGEQMTEALKGATGMAAMGGVELERVGSVYTKVAAQGKLQGDELMQFSEMGVNALGALADYFGVTQAEAREMVTAGKVDFASFSAAMNKMYGDAAKGANETFSGAMSNVNAALSRVGAKFASPALEGLRKVFVALIPAIDAVSKLLDPLVERFTAFVDATSGNAVAAIEAFTNALTNGGSIIDGFKAAFGALPESVQKAMEVFAGFAGVIAGGAVAGKIAQIGGVIAGFAPKIAGFATKLVGIGSKLPVIGGLFATLGSKMRLMGSAVTLCGGGLKGVASVIGGTLAGPVGIAIGLIAALAAGFAYLWNTNDEFRASMTQVGSELMATLAPCLQRIGELISNLAQTVLPVITNMIQSLVPVLAQVVEVGINALAAVLPVIAELIAAIVPVVAQIIEAVVRVGATLVESLVPVISMIASVIQRIMPLVLDIVQQVIEFVIPIVQQIVQLIQDNMPMIQNIISTVVGIVMNVIAVAMPVIQAIVTLAMKMIHYVITTVWPIIQQIITSVMDAVQNIITTVWPIVQGVITVAMEVIQSIITNVWPLLRDIITTAMGVIQNIIETAWPVIQNIIETVMSVIQGVIDTVWPIISGVIDAAMSVIQGVINAVMCIIEGDWEGAWNAIKDALGDAWESIKTGVSDGIDAVMEFIQDLPDKIMDFFSDAGSWLLDAGENILYGLWDGIEGALGWLGDKLGGIGSFIAEHKGPESYDLKLLVPNGGWIMEGLTAGIENGIPALRKTLSGVAESVQGFGSEIAPFDDVNANVKTWRNVEFRDDRESMVDEVVGLLRSYLPEMAKDKQLVMDTGVVAGALAPAIDKNLGIRSARRSKGL